MRIITSNVSLVLAYRSFWWPDRSRLSAGSVERDDVHVPMLIINLLWLDVFILVFMYFQIRSQSFLEYAPDCARLAIVPPSSTMLAPFIRPIRLPTRRRLTSVIVSHHEREQAA